MTSPLPFLKDIFQKALVVAFPDLEIDPLSHLVITPSTREDFGHYQYNSALKLSKIFKKPPREIAQELLKNLPLESKDLFSKIEIAGPGFINLFFAPHYLNSHCQQLLEDPHLGLTPRNREKVIVEYSSPNIAKEMHVGHLRSTIIGECLARVLDFLGYEVMRLNHVGDWGTSFGMLIAYLKLYAPAVIQGSEEATLEDLCQWYKDSKKKFDEDPDFKKEAQLAVVALQKGQKQERQAWESISQISRKAYQEIYKLLDVNLVERGESFYNFMLEEVVQDLESKKLITLSQGAKCVFIEGIEGKDQQPFPLMVQKSDGGYNYDTTDVAAMKHRIQKEKAQRIIVVVDSGQSLHFTLVSKTCEKAAYLDPEKVRFDHVGFGLVLGPDGKKFKTRSGESVKLIDLLHQGIKKAKMILQEKNPELQGQALEKQAHALGLGAIKYADLSCNRISDYSFSFERMLRFEGNTACYVMYAYVRLLSIQEKAGFASLSSLPHFSLKHPSEVALAIHLIKFPDILEQLAQDLLPNKLTDYLYQLADKFNTFFRDCRVEGHEQQKPRLFLCELSRKIFEKGFFLLGIPLLKKM